MDLRMTETPSPLGPLRLVAGAQGLVAVLWPDDDPARVPQVRGAVAGRMLVLDEARRQLAEYFSGARRVFDLPLDMRGTDFQQQVWRGLLDIPYGQTRSYAALAAAIDRPKATRAVGAANGRNPLSIVVPCHRVIGGNGQLTGFAGGLAAKRFLLDLERA